MKMLKKAQHLMLKNIFINSSIYKLCILSFEQINFDAFWVQTNIKGFLQRYIHLNKLMNT